MVAELGMNHAGELDRLGAIAEPDALLYTVVAPVHLEFFPDVDAIAEAKAELIRHLRSDGLLVLNAADRRVAGFADRFGGSVLRYGVADESDLWLEGYRENGLLGSAFRLTGPLATLEVEWPIPGRHQADNLLAAAALALAVGVAPTAIPPCAARLAPPPDAARCTCLATAASRSWTTATTPRPRRRGRLSTCWPPHRGDASRCSARCSSWDPARPRSTGRSAGRPAAAANVVVAVGGESAAVLARAAEGVEAHHVADATEALDLLRGLLRPGDVVLVKGSRGIGLDLVVDGLRAGVR